MANFTFIPKFIPKDSSKHGTYGATRSNNNVAYGDFSKFANISGVYSIKNKITNKQYIGSTTNLQFRLGKHFSELFLHRHRTKKLQEDFDKYGYNSFEFILLEKCSKEDLLKREVEYQKSFNIEDLYNERITGVYVDPEYRKKLANASKESHKTKEYREKMSKLKTNKVAQYDLNMKLIKIWDSAIQICEELGYTRSVILSCCNGSKPHAYKFNWRYVDDNGNIVKDGYDKGRKNKI